MKARLFMPPVILGLLLLLIVTTGDALLWSVPHALDKLPPRILTVAVLTALWLVHRYRRATR
ncbi:hypothetical protein U5A82_12855 [Sphingobium sp. CR2-8]|uniref:hypothetical protein n=1 Tax=Sphingobium sp. CR2-8 TaxID=1306534 RepID=UPI002DB5D250|nr:hypothetical protein [Sphingobium sp. CR2-8]MEC3911321.1 hypothetical protein [Sphingobium sp. CR2-8]